MIHVVSNKRVRRANNYFKPFGGNKLFLFDATDTKSTEVAWQAACVVAVEPSRVSCFRPFPIAGAWWGAHLIGYTIAPPPHDDERPETAEARTRLIRAWNDTRAYLL